VNLVLLSSALDLLLRSLLDFSDPGCQKIVCAVLVKMIAMWGDDPGTSLAGSKGTKKGSASQISIKRRLLPGFDEFIFKSIIPILFKVPFEKNSLNLNNGQVSAFLTELTSLHRTIYISQGSKYVNYLTTVAFPSYNIPSDSASAFITALSTNESKNFKKFLQDFIQIHQKQ
jgi:exportin-T